MKIQRVNIFISSNQNTHRKYLYNEVYSLMKQYRVGAEYNPYRILLYKAPVNIIKALNKLNIRYTKEELK